MPQDKKTSQKGLAVPSQWCKIANEKVNIKLLDKLGTNRHRRECFKVAMYLHRNQIESKSYPSLVLDEFLRQLAGPEIFDVARSIEDTSYDTHLEVFLQMKRFVLSGEM